MKVLIVNTSDIQGGAARAAHRLHHALLSSGVDSHMLVHSKLTDEYSIIGPEKKFEKLIARTFPSLDSLFVNKYKQRSKTLFSANWLPNSSLIERINEFDPDIVHLHWINSGMIRIEDIAKIKAPIIWSLHDMWAFTGGCHYDEECGKYQNSCGECPVLSSNKENDLSKKVWKRKQSTYEKIENITVVGLSKWLADCSSSSSLLGSKEVVNLPNPIDTAKFSPFDKLESRKLFNLPLDKKLILFGAMGATSDPRKGFIELTSALDYLPEDYELVVFGSSEPKTSQGFKQKTHYLGQLHDDISLRALYSAADVMIVPSLQENLSNAIMESLACGTPVVGFSIGGNSDLIEHEKNGYLAKPFETADLAKGIEWVLNVKKHEELCQNARDKVLREFDGQVVAKKYIQLYRSIIESGEKA
ncbi:MAG: glycosyl transferase family 1 [Marinomonas sp.]|nr:glycosyl transferase family 1 [Marinomonas sp.]MAF16632.1 glycosyl transferase family 1 [Marinomonas sp.]